MRLFLSCFAAFFLLVACGCGNDQLKTEPDVKNAAPIGPKKPKQGSEIEKLSGNGD